jgi:hypothetical protein
MTEQNLFPCVSFTRDGFVPTVFFRTVWMDTEHPVNPPDLRNRSTNMLSRSLIYVILVRKCFRDLSPSPKMPFTSGSLFTIRKKDFLRKTCLLPSVYQATSMLTFPSAFFVGLAIGGISVSAEVSTVQCCMVQ